MANKIPRTVSLSAVVWARVDDLHEIYGDSPAETLTHILNDWFSKNQSEISNRRQVIKRLRPQIDAMQQPKKKM